MPTIQTRSGEVFEVGCDMQDATSNNRPDVHWKHVDAHGHTHQWYANGQPATSYSPTQTYSVPSLVWVNDGEEWDADDEAFYKVGHNECRECGEHIEPARTADTTQQLVPGLRWCRINGVSVSREEFERRLDEAKNT